MKIVGLIILLIVAACGGFVIWGTSLMLGMMPNGYLGIHDQRITSKTAVVTLGLERLSDLPISLGDTLGQLNEIMADPTLGGALGDDTGNASKVPVTLPAPPASNTMFRTTQSTETGTVQSSKGLIGLNTRIKLNSNNGKALFVGIAPGSQVNQYLSNVERDSISEISFDPVGVSVGCSQLTLVSGLPTRSPGAAPCLRGTRLKLTPPRQQLWSVKKTGAHQLTLDWKLSTNVLDSVVVLTNMDGSTGIDVQAGAGVKIPFVRPVLSFIRWVAIAITSIVGLLIAMIILKLVNNSNRRPPQEPFTGHYAQPTSYGGPIDTRF